MQKPMYPTRRQLPFLFTLFAGCLLGGCADPPDVRQQISQAVDSGRERMVAQQRTTDLQRRVSSLQYEVTTLEQQLDSLQRQVEHLCVWEHTELDGTVVTTLLPLDCATPIHSRSARVVSTAYYSPLGGQQRYATGSLRGDQRLNGKGEWTADSTRPGSGTVAAPPEYAFGTQLYIEGYGAGTVHDRGSAIQRGRGYDRLDLWMGRGDDGLARSEAWGIREIEAAVFVAGDPDDIAAVLEQFVS